MEQTPATRFVDVLGRLGYKTQQQIADLLDIARPTAGTIVRYEKPPSFESIATLKEKHPEINMEWIFTGNGTAFVTGEVAPTQQLPPPLPPAVPNHFEEAGPLTVAAPTREEFRKLQQENQQLREQLAAQSGKLEVVEEDRQWLRSQIGGKALASLDAAGEDAAPVEMTVSRNHDFVAVPEEVPMRKIGYAGNYIR